MERIPQPRHSEIGEIGTVSLTANSGGVYASVSRLLQPRYSFAPTNHVAVYGSIVHVAWLNNRLRCRFAEVRRSQVGSEWRREFCILG